MSHASLTALRNSARLAALRQLGVLGTPADPSFDRLTRLAARVLNAPVALVSFVDEDRQFFKSAVGLKEPWATRRETPLSYSFCQYVVASGEPLIINDAREHDLLRDNLSVAEMGVVAYAGIPLTTRDGQQLGSFCVIDYQPRTWTPAEIDILNDLSASVMTEIELMIDIAKRRRIEEDLREEFAFSTAIIESASEGLCVCHPIAEYPYVAFTVWNDRMIEITGYTMDEINRLGWYQTLYVDPDLQARAQARMERMRHGDDLIAEEWQITRADGQQRVVAFSTSVLDTQDGNTHVLALLYDITERKRAEAALRESEERARRLSEVAFEGIAIHDQGIILDANQALASIMGYEHHEVIGMPVLTFAAPESHDLIVANIRSEATQPSEVVGLRKDGSRVVVELRAKSTWYQGRSVRVTAIRDITARKQAEEALRESEERFRTLIRDLQVGVLLQGPQSEILLSNQAALDLLGLTEDQLLGKTSFDPQWNVIHEDGTPFPGPDHPVPQAIATHRPVRDVVMGVYRPLTKDRAWLLVNAEPQLADDGSVRQVICSFSDITTSKRAEEALRESEERYRAFFEHSIDAILLTAPDGSIFAANPAACQIFDRTEAEICQVGRNGLIDTTDPRLPVALEHRARTGKFKGELTFLRQDGTPFPGELSTALFRDRDGSLRTSMIVRNITERKRAEHEREELIDALQNALANIKTLRGLLPICASCKKIRDDLGYWSQIEAYVQAHSDAVFSHGICPDCARKLYSEFLEE